MKAARIIQPNRPLEIQQLQMPKPKASQVLVKVQAVGVCHSDLHLWEGAYEGLEGQVIKTTDRGITYPLTPGHEIAGVIESIGEDVKEFAIDDRVLIYPWIGDGLCPACREGKENVCDKPKSLGIYSDGGYAESVLVPDKRYLIKLDDKMDINAGAILGCSVLTAYGAVKNAMLRPNETAIVVGAGGIGLMAIQSIKATTEARTIAIDIDDKKLQAAKSSGADIVINSKTQDPVKSVMELTDNRGADAVLDIVNASKTVETDMQLLRKRGRVVLVGLFGGELRLSLLSMPTRAYRLIGSYTGTMFDLIELVSLAQRGVIKPVVSDRYRLDQATEALSKLKAGQVIGRGVINP